MLVYDRQTNTYSNTLGYKDKYIRFLYNTILGRILLKMVVIRPYFSKLITKYKKSKFSRKDVDKFIKEYNIDISEYNMREIKSFNDFFTRKREINIKNTEEKELNAIADAKLAVYNINDELMLTIKNTIYSLEELVEDKQIIQGFKGGKCLVYRLALEDYHRYHYLDSGELVKQYEIKGVLHTVRSVSNRYRVFCRNTRTVNILRTDNFGDVIQVEVGALTVGKIVNNKDVIFNKLEEKGHFELGGSTIVVILGSNVKIDKDIEEQSSVGIETAVKIGERIGERIDD